MTNIKPSGILTLTRVEHRKPPKQQIVHAKIICTDAAGVEWYFMANALGSELNLVFKKENDHG